MTKKEKILIGLLQESSEVFKNTNQKELVKFIHTVNKDFDSMSPFSWSEHHGGKKTKNKIKNIFSPTKK